MGLKGGPNVVEDGLVLALDAANDKSFRGEPTENLLINPIFIDNSENNIPDGYAISGLSSGNNSFSLNDGILTITNNSGERNFITPFSSNLPNFEDGKQYTFSVTIHRADANFRFAWISNNSGIMVNDLVDLSKPFPQRGSVTINSSGSNTIRLGIGVSTSDVEGIVSFSKVQLEEKPYATPFVDGTRGTTVATGGGWADRSGNNNHGELINGPTFNSDNLGSIEFDGVNDRITATNIIDVNSCTFDIFCKIDNPSASGGSQIVFGYPNGTNQRVYLGFTSNGWDVGIQSQAWGSTSIPVDTNWHNFIVTLNNGTIKIYYDGVDLRTKNYTTFTTSGNIISLGDNFSTSHSFAGKTALFKSYNRALNAEEILQNFNATKGRYGL